VPARCTVALTRRGDGCQAETEDIGPGGCLVVTPRLLRAGEPVGLHIESDHVPRPLRVLGRVAWVGHGGRPRAGVAFAQDPFPSRTDPAAWFQAFCKAEPGVATRRTEAPARIAHDAPLYLRTPPKFIVDFSHDELAVLRIIDAGITVSRVLAHPEAGPHADRAIFALIARRFVTLAPLEAVPAWEWRPLLERATGQPVASHRRAPPRPPPDPAPRLEATPPPRPDILPAIASPGPVAVPVEGLAASAPERHARPRPSRAQLFLDQARAAVESNDVGAAIALLRRALILAPGDAEIASLLGQLAFKDRWV
jgi:hypothetical protein